MIKFLRMKTPADMLAINYFASSGQLKGRFVQEVEPPWTIWWEVPGEQGFIGRIGSMIQGQIEAPETIWEEGTPNSALKAMSWLDLFRKAIIKPEDTKRVAAEVIMMTSNKEVFFAAIKNHFMLQQGRFEFAVFDAKQVYYMIRITDPSLWVFNTLKADEFVWFNQLDGHSGIFVEAGWRIVDINGPECFNKFKIVEGGILLVQKDGRLLNLKPAWKKGESIIKVDFGEIQIPQKDESDGLVIQPTLRQTDRRSLEMLWKIEDRSKLRAIIANESLKSFRHFDCWACGDGKVFIIARPDQADRGLASVLTDAFPSYSEMDAKVMVPSGYLLAPRLSSERLHKMFKATSSDYICFEKNEQRIDCLILPGASMIKVEDFIALEIEGASNAAQIQKPVWKFDFKELKKKKTVIYVEETKPFIPKLEATSEDGQVLSGQAAGPGARRQQKRTLNLENVPQIGDAELSQLRLQIDAIDAQLNANATDAFLWRKRSEIAVKMRLKISALASAMNAAALNLNHAEIMDCALEFCKQNDAVAPLAADSLTEVEKGRLLAAIRDDSLSAEVHYALLLTFAARFNDKDIFGQAVAGMKTGFSTEKRQFYNFNETRVAGGGGMNLENRVELLTVKDLPRISMNVKKFLLQVGCGGSMLAIAITKLQLRKLLSENLDPETAAKLVGSINLSFNSFYSSYPWDGPNRSSEKRSGVVGFTDYFVEQIENWPESMNHSGNNAAVARWLKLLTMDKIRETPLRDFFTGELYKPPYMFFRKEETSAKYGIVKNLPWLDKASKDEFPQVCDGKPIARLIYQRFSDGHKDWNSFFRIALSCGDMAVLARSQRLLLLMVSEFGPHPGFAEFIAPARADTSSQHGWDIFSLTMYCDMFRLSLAYRKPVDEQRLFNLLINRIPQPPRGWEDFRDSAEWIILCLLLTSSPVRRFQLDNLTARAMRWLQEAINKNDYQVFAETLTILCFLGVGTLADLVPEKLEFHQLLEKRRVFWIQHAFALAGKGDQAFKEWVEAYNN